MFCPFATVIKLYDYRNRTYSPKWGRFIEVDPIRFEGRDLNLYRYVKNWVMELIDPWGLYTEVIFWLPSPESPFGHISATINGTSFSWGKEVFSDFMKDNMSIQAESRYIRARSTISEGYGIQLNLSPEQELDLERYFWNLFIDNDEYVLIGGNCMNVVQNALKSIGIDVGAWFTPQNFYDRLTSMFPENEIIHHPYIPKTKN